FFYRKHKNNFEKVICFGNLPPSIRLKAEVFTYFHQLLFLDIPNSLSLFQRIIFNVKSKIFKIIKQNTDFWIVQTDEVKKRLLQKLEITNEINTKVIPFYPPLDSSNIISPDKKGFLYASNGSSHKNHLNLLLGFKKYCDTNDRKQELHLTVGNEFTSLINEIEKLKNLGYPIINHGFVPRPELSNLYSKIKFVIYPSLSESFGLGLIEAIELGCDVIAADLPYAYVVCKPSSVFNPLEINEIAQAFVHATNHNIKKTEQIVFNEINLFLELLK
ncbi:glycosyltransferase, partial [Flavobacterium facile]